VTSAQHNDLSPDVYNHLANFNNSATTPSNGVTNLEHGCASNDESYDRARGKHTTMRSIEGEMNYDEIVQIL
jgi:hypothetical protein